MKRSYPLTIIVDLDGVVIKHSDPYTWYDNFEVLPDVHKRLREWWDRRAHIIIMSGRPECLRRQVEDQLEARRVFYHQLILGVTSGCRVVINDTKPYDEPRQTAVAINVKRNLGLIDIILPED